MASPLSDCDVVADTFPMLIVSRTGCCITTSISKSPNTPDIYCNDDGRIRYLSTSLVNLDQMFPTTLMQLSDLEELKFDRSGLYGQLPDSISNFTKLRVLYLGANKLSGRIPLSIATMQNLEQLTLAENSFDGPIPAGLGRLAKISVISLTNNLLTGEIPSSFVNLFSISTMELDRNRLSGNIPAFLTGLRNLTNLQLQGNYFTGPVPNLWRWGNTLDRNCINESDIINFNNSISIVQKQRPSAECLAFYGSAIQVPATSGLPSTTATSFVPSNTPTSPTTDKTTILVVSITTSLLLVFALTAITLYVVRRRRHSGIKPLFRFSSATSSVELEPRFSSHPIVVQPLNEKDEMARSTLFANLDVVENRGPLDDIASYAKSGLNGSGTGPASTIGWSSTLVKEAGRSMGSVGWSSSVATSSAGDSVTVGGEVDEKVVDRDFMAIDPEEWTRREVVLWLTRCGFRPEVIETFEAHKITGALLMEVTEERLMDMGITEDNSRALIDFAVQRLRYSKRNGGSSETTLEASVTINRDIPPVYS